VVRLPILVQVLGVSPSYLSTRAKAGGTMGEAGCIFDATQCRVVLPGGSVMALLLWLYRRRKNGAGFGQFPVRLLAFLGLANPLHFNAARSAVGSITAPGL
jgi:hypothetical protein